MEDGPRAGRVAHEALAALSGCAIFSALCLVVGVVAVVVAFAGWDSGPSRVEVIEERVSPEGQWAAQQVYAEGGGAAGWTASGIRLGRRGAGYDDQDWIVRDHERVVEEWQLEWTGLAELTIRVRCYDGGKLPRREDSKWGDVRVLLERIPE